jgi:hypothetical protein
MPDDVDARVRIAIVLKAAAVGDVFREIEVAAIGRDSRFSCVLLPVAAVGELEPRSTSGVIHPHLAGTQRARVAKMLSPDEVLAIRRPCWIGYLTFALPRDLPKVAARCIHGPQILDAIAIAGERDAFPVRRPAWHGLERRARQNARSCASGERHCVDVAQQVEHERATIGRHVHRHPRAFGCREFHVATGAVLRHHIPPGGDGGRGVLHRFLRLQRWRGCQQRRGKESKGDKGALHVSCSFVEDVVHGVLQALST